MNDREISSNPPRGRKKYKSRRVSRLTKFIMIGGSIFIVLIFIAIFIVAALF